MHKTTNYAQKVYYAKPVADNPRIYEGGAGNQIQNFKKNAGHILKNIMIIIKKK